MKVWIEIKIIAIVALLLMTGGAAAQETLLNSILPPDHLLENLPWLGADGKIESHGLFDFEDFRGLGPKDVILVYRQSAPVSELDKPHNETLAICFFDTVSQKYIQALAVEDGPIQWMKLLKESNWPSPILVVLRNDLKGHQILQGYTCVHNQIKQVLEAQAPQVFAQFPMGSQSGSILVSSTEVPRDMNSAEHDFVWDTSDDQLAESSYKGTAGWVGDSILLPTPTAIPQPKVIAAPRLATTLGSAHIAQSSTSNWWDEPFDAQNTYTRLVTELVPQYIKNKQIGVLGKKAQAFFRYAQQKGVKGSAFKKMRSGYYTAVASTLFDMKRIQDTAYYLKLALSYQSDNEQALALKAKIKK